MTTSTRYPGFHFHYRLVLNIFRTDKYPASYRRQARRNAHNCQFSLSDFNQNWNNMTNLVKVFLIKFNENPFSGQQFLLVMVKWICTFWNISLSTRQKWPWSPWRGLSIKPEKSLYLLQTVNSYTFNLICTYIINFISRFPLKRYKFEFKIFWVGK
jgi:hypothetical protein